VTAPEVEPSIRAVVDPDGLDVATVHHWLSTDAYWALGRPLDVVERAVAQSVNLAAYDGDDFVGYARIVTDRATFAWLCDVYVAPAGRGRGVGKALMAKVDETLAEFGVGRTLLATDDAHGLYEGFGFEPLTETRKWMIRSRPQVPGE
jgi:GNAT superfamily N-acetyltransferase